MSLGFYVDLASCIGCKTCQVACKDRRDIQVAVSYTHLPSRKPGAITWPVASMTRVFSPMQWAALCPT